MNKLILVICSSIGWFVISFLIGWFLAEKYKKKDIK